ncbi:hypothetical protein GCM10028805_60360 [Spirosoma harenae]
MMKKYFFLSLFLCAYTIVFCQNGPENKLSDFKNYGFASGEKILFEENYVLFNNNEFASFWNLEGGKVELKKEGAEGYISIKEYYTKLSPKLKPGTVLPQEFTIEYDTWLADGYDGNPGIEVNLLNGDKFVVITPNKHEMSVNYPEDGHASEHNPDEYAGESKFYNRWVHIAMAYSKKHLTVYLDQYKMIDIPDCRLIPTKILITGNTSNDMKILLKNFRLATGIPAKAIELKDGKFITHSIRFDVNKAIIKAESMPVLTKLVAYMQQNPANFQIGGHTDSDGDDASNMKLSQARADAVKAQLITMGIKPERLQAQGFGETKPLNPNTTPEQKANNRRVEFTAL